MRKLREAEYFLREIGRRSRDYQPNEHAEIGRYYISAFLSAARSVTMVMQAEQKFCDWEPWFAAWRAERSEADRALLRFMNGQRVAEVHREGAEVEVRAEFVDYDWKGPPWLLQSSFGPGIVPAPKVPLNKWHFDDGRPAVETCDTYYALIHHLVQRGIETALAVRRGLIPGPTGLPERARPRTFRLTDEVIAQLEEIAEVWCTEASAALSRLVGETHEQLHEAKQANP